MRNRAKCKLCNDILESFHVHDYVTCNCGEISIDGGNYYHKCSAKNWSNFLRIDDDGNEIIPKVVDEKVEVKEEEPKKLSKAELIKMLEDMIQSFDKLPVQGMTAPVTQFDLQSALMVVLAVFKAD